MKSPRDLLKGLLEYIEEQAKEIDPKDDRPPFTLDIKGEWTQGTNGARLKA